MPTLLIYLCTWERDAFSLVIEPKPHYYTPNPTLEYRVLSTNEAWGAWEGGKEAKEVVDGTRVQHKGIKPTQIIRCVWYLHVGWSQTHHGPPSSITGSAPIYRCWNARGHGLAHAIPYPRRNVHRGCPLVHRCSKCRCGHNSSMMGKGRGSLGCVCALSAHVRNHV